MLVRVCTALTLLPLRGGVCTERERERERERTTFYKADKSNHNTRYMYTCIHVYLGTSHKIDTIIKFLKLNTTHIIETVEHTTSFPWQSMVENTRKSKAPKPPHYTHCKLRVNIIGVHIHTKHHLTD